jgi:hypothetical protein
MQSVHRLEIDTSVSESVMKKLNISDTVALTDDYVTKTVAILAQRRVGKTYTASVIAEEMVAAKIPFVGLDPTGAWYGLRSSADGKKPGLPVVILGGQHGDVPLERGAGKFIADLVLDYPGWYVIDFSLFESGAAERQFATDFAERLYRRKGQPNMDFAMHLFVDECDRFIPQRVGGGRGEARETDQRLLGAFESIVRRGGIRGLGTTLISQRAAVVNKNVLEQIDVLIALRVVGPNDRRAIEDYLKSDADDEQRKAMMGSLSSLGLGEAWVWEPGGEPSLFDRVQIRERHTFNSSATPKPGQKRVEPSKFAAVDLSAVKDQMAEAIQRAEANDPKALQKRIAELEKQLVAKPAVMSRPQIVTERIEVPTPFIPEGLLDDLLAEVQKGLEGASVLLSGHVKRVVGSHVLDARLDGESKSPKAPKRAVISAPTPSIATTERAGKSNDDLPTQMGKAERSILSVLAQFADGRTRSQVATLSGYSAKSSSFGNALSRLRTLGYINKSGEPIRATNEAIDAIAGQYEPLPTGRALLDHWNSKLGKAERIILGVAIEAWPASLSREEVARLSGYSETSSSFGNALSKLRTLELISGRGEILAEDTLAREAGR